MLLLKAKLIKQFGDGIVAKIVKAVEITTGNGFFSVSLKKKIPKLS